MKQIEFSKYIEAQHKIHAAAAMLVTLRDLVEASEFDDGLSFLLGCIGEQLTDAKNLID